MDHHHFENPFYRLCRFFHFIGGFSLLNEISSYGPIVKDYNFVILEDASANAKAVVAQQDFGNRGTCS